MSPLVNVIIPTYNRASMLTAAVDSVLAQTFPDFEVIVVDDGSTDETLDKLSAYGDRVRVISQQRRGVAAARNTGARAANGRYLAFLDSDDRWVPKKLAVQTAFMEASPNGRICQTDETWVRNNVRVNPRARHRKPSGDIFRRSLELCLVSLSAVMLTRDLFESSGGFDESFPVCEDYDLWLRIALNQEVSLIPEQLVVKTGGHPDQLSRSEWGLDRFRVRALAKLLTSGISGEKRLWVCNELRRKVNILAAGARKRGKETEAVTYEEFLRSIDPCG